MAIKLKVKYRGAKIAYEGDEAGFDERVEKLLESIRGMEDADRVRDLAAVERVLLENQAEVNSLVEEMDRLVANGHQKREELLAKIAESPGDDAQLRQLELQDALQAHDRLIQSISNIMKVWNETLKNIIANMK